MTLKVQRRKPTDVRSGKKSEKGNRIKASQELLKSLRKKGPVQKGGSTGPSPSWGIRGHFCLRVFVQGGKMGPASNRSLQRLERVQKKIETKKGVEKKN